MPTLTRRRTVSRHSDKAAFIRQPDGDAAPCAIEDISRTGAMIALKEAMPLPVNFVLDLTGNNTLTKGCELVWQKGRFASVRFQAGAA